MPIPTPEALVAEMRTIALVAGQCSVEGPDDAKALMAAAEAERASRWADSVEVLLLQRAQEIEDLIAKWRAKQLAAGRCSVDMDVPYAAGEADTLHQCADELAAALQGATNGQNQA